MSEHRLRCAACGRPASLADLVPLWDGERYCTACLDSELPSLADCARTQKALTYVIERRSASVCAGIMRIWSYFVAMAFALFGTPFIGLALASPRFSMREAIVAVVGCVTLGPALALVPAVIVL